jgi:hypothetical protein
MATITEYVNTGNDGAAHTAVFGGPLAGGGTNAGTSANPYNDWATLYARITDTSVNHSADDLVINVHPATIYLGGASNIFQIITSLGKHANSWKSVRCQIWQSVIDGDARYTDWYPTIDTCQEISSWTRGYVDGGGAFVPDASNGDVYRGEGTAEYADWRYLLPVGGHDRKDCRTSTRPQRMRFCTALSELSEEADYSLANKTGTTQYVYVKTGAPGVNPTAKWGHSFVYVAQSVGREALYFINSANFTWDKLQTNGGYVHVNAGTSEGQYSENIHFPNYRGRIRSIRGIYFRAAGSLPTTYVLNCSADNAKTDAWTPRSIIGSADRENGTANGLHIEGKVDGFSGANFSGDGFSHGQIFADAYSFADTTSLTGANQFGDVPYYVFGAFDGAGLDGRRTFWITISGSFNATVTLQKSASTGGPWTDVKTWTGAVSNERFNDGNSDAVYYRLGIKTGEYISGTASARIFAMPFPRNLNFPVTTFDGGASTLTGAPSTEPGANPNYQRGIGLHGQRIRVGPFRVRNQTVQCQFVGSITLSSMEWDSSCVAYSDPVGSNNYNIGHHASWGPALSVFNGSEAGSAATMPEQRLRGYGLKHDLVGGQAGLWERNCPDDALELRSCLVRDSGHARYRPQTNLANSTLTRRIAPYLSYMNSTGGSGPLARLKNIKLIADPAVVGLVSKKVAGQSDTADASDASYPLTQVDGTGTDWGGGRISGGVEGTEADFGFDASLAYIGPRLTPVQTGARVGRGYR